MTAAVARVATPDDHPLLDGYAAWCRTLGMSDRVLRDRLLQARQFLAAHPDLDAWMRRPVHARLADLGRIRAWPLVTYLILAGEVDVDLDLLLAKGLGGFGQAAERLRPGDFTAVRAAAGRLGWSPRQTVDVVVEFLPVVLAWCHRATETLTEADLDGFWAVVDASPVASGWARGTYRSRLYGLRQLLYEARILDLPPTRGPTGAGIAGRLAAVPAPEIRRVMVRYLHARAPALRPSSISGLTEALICFGEFLGAAFPQVTSLRQLQRPHLEAFLAWNQTRPWRGRVARPRPVAASVAHATVLAVRNFLDDLTLWGWAERPRRRLVFATDVPRLARPLPRALAPDVDAALMAAVHTLSDPFARCGLLILRATGLRLGELLDLELGSIIDYGPAGTWLRVPVGKLATERSVPLDADSVAVFDQWAAARGPQRALPHPRDGHLVDFLFCQRGRRLTPWRLRRGLEAAVRQAGLLGTDGAPLRVVPHQLRHTYATRLVNAGTSLQALMALLGHVTPEMTLRYATLASPTLRGAYDQAMGKLQARRLLPLAPIGRPPVPTRVQWLHSEFLKTRVAHGYCSRHLAAQACPYANICEQCDNFVPAPQFTGILQAQLADIHQLRADAERRGWTGEAQRHSRVITHLEAHLARLTTSPPHPASS